MHPSQVRRSLRHADPLKRVHHLTWTRITPGTEAQALCGYWGTARDPDEALRDPCCPMCALMALRGERGSK